MTCTNKYIKELLPAYLEQGLDKGEAPRVERHLETCEDCRKELDLLRTMAEGPVPDPGGAFWATMPDRVYQEIQRQKASERSSKRRGFTGFLETMHVPRWAWATAAAAAVLAISLLSLRPAPDGTVAKTALLPEEEMSYQDMFSGDPVDLAGLTPAEQDRLATWADSRFAAIADEAGNAALNSRDRDLYEEMADLDAKEIERFSTLIDKWNEEV